MQVLFLRNDLKTVSVIHPQYITAMFLFRFHITKIQPGSIYYPLRLFQAASTQSNVKVFLFLSKCTFTRTSTIKVVVVVVKKKDSEIKHLNQTLTNWVIIWNIPGFTRA